MKRFLAYGYLSLLYWPAIYAQNLVVNGSFEDENICTEYQKNCAPEAWIATSLWANYYFDATMPNTAQAFDGYHFVGLTAGNILRRGMRNFIRTRLLCGLRKDHQYQLEFYVRSLHPVLDSIGVYFSQSDFLYEKSNFQDITPQLWSVNGLEEPRKRTSIWQKVHLIYTASGTEGYITIGNFKRTDYTGIRESEYRYDYYFFLDEVSLTPLDSAETLCLQADSVKKDIYTENERHGYLEKKIYYLKKNPPRPKPLPSTREQVQRIDTLVIPDIFFATASYELTATSYQLLDSFARQLSQLVIDSVVIEGHTDSIGKLAYNEALSLNRATSVKNYVAGRVPGITTKSISRGYAFLRPVASNKTPAGRRQNRRVEILVYRKEYQ